MKTETLLLQGNPDPVLLYQRLTKNKGRLNTMILESADVHTKAGQKSFLMIDAALKIRAFNRHVTIETLTPFGEAFLERLLKLIRFPISSKKKNQIIFDISSDNRGSQLSEKLNQPSVFDILRSIVSLYWNSDPKEACNFLTAGIFSYDLIDHFEVLPKPLADPLEFPDYVFWIPESFVSIDHIRGTTRIVNHNLNEPQDFLEQARSAIVSLSDKEAYQFEKDPVHVSEYSVDLTDNEYSDLVLKLKQNVIAGDVFQIVPSRTFSMPCENSLDLYVRLKSINPSPYMYYVVDDSFELCGASPETFVKFSSSTREVEVKPIAGTRRRGTSANGKIDHELDSRLEAELRLDTKELAEHMMLVDLARNDIARVSKLGTRRVHSLLGVERFSHVMHLVSHVRGELRADLDGLHAYQASMNMGTLVGAPKIKAAEILRCEEKTKRGTYGGAIGYLDAAGNFDTAIIIRSAFIKDKMAYVRAGAGVVYDSIPIEEANETKSKASSVLRALGAKFPEGKS